MCSRRPAMVKRLMNGVDSRSSLLTQLILLLANPR